MTRLKSTFKQNKDLLNIYITAGFPKLHDTISIVKSLEDNGADIIEIGMPFSDPLADGPTIQHSSKIAIDNGMTLSVLFKQVKEIRKTVQIPILLMGYYNQIIQYGSHSFFKKAKQVGVDGFIIPDLPLQVYKENYKGILNELELSMHFLISPQTTDERVLEIDNSSDGFIYMVSSYAITGSKKEIDNRQLDYFNRIENMALENPRLIGFGISNKETFKTACQYAQGAIIGSAFIKAIEHSNNLDKTISSFIRTIKG